MKGSERVQVKICGITTPEDALMCAGFGADAVGLVFYPKSPRFVTDGQARAVTDALPPSVAAVGVFVNETAQSVLAHARTSGIEWAQLHGQEPPETVDELRASGIRVIKVLFINRAPNFIDAALYRPDAFLMECAEGALPGGNAKTWDWTEALGVTGEVPMILAGGLSAENAAFAATGAKADALDASSALESAYGKKDEKRVRAFMDAIRALPPRNTRRIF
ncbi:MAG: phosphoribosylanthranilate isomerase [Deltaproteobacteria bacterium]|nr:phosphoribosylanthranilate isomerase [Deltaproteobacteria bacterium]